MKMKDPIGELVNANDVISGTKGKSMVSDGVYCTLT